MHLDDDTLEQQSLWKSYKAYTGKLEFEEIFGSLNVDLFGRSAHRPTHLSETTNNVEGFAFDQVTEFVDNLKNTLYFFSKKYEHTDEKALLNGLLANHEYLGMHCQHEIMTHVTKMIKSIFGFLFKAPNFSTGILINKTFETFSEAFLASLRSMLISLFSAPKCEPQSIVQSQSKREKKSKRQWTKEEEKELLDLMQQHYPMQIPNDFLADFIQKYGRSKSSLINKIQKLKNKFMSNFECRENEIIQSFPFIKDFKEIDSSLEQAVINAIHAKRQLSYNQILHFLELPKYNVDQGDQVDKVLYRLLNEKRVFCDERLFVELKKDAGPSDKKSSIVDKIERHLFKAPLQTMTLEDLKDFVVSEFPVVEKDLSNFDEQLIEFLKQSGRFVLRSQRVFY
jgi:hypothetical protein